jgi:hypothetical protein
MRTFSIVFSLIILIILFTAVNCLSVCDGDLDCNGVVDGVDLAKFSASFGNTGCPGQIPAVIGSVFFEGFGEIELRSIHLALHRQVADSGRSTGRTMFDDIQISIGVDDELTPRLNRTAAEGGYIPEVILYYAGLKLLELRSVLITRINYLPPAASGDPFLLSLSLNFARILFTWEGQEAGWNVAQNTGSSCSQGEFHFVQTIGYAGSMDFGNTAPVDHFSFAMSRIDTSVTGGSRTEKPSFETLDTIGAVSDVSLCQFSKIATGNVIDKVLLEKWGPKYDRYPEMRIELEMSEIMDFAIYSSATGGLEQKTAFAFGRIKWIHWGGSDPDNPEQIMEGFDIEKNSSF